MKTKYLGVLILLFSFFCGGVQIQSDTTCYKNINCDDFYLLYETQDVFIIDVRYFKDYKKERIHKANSAPDKDLVTLLLEGIDKNKSIYIYCYIGVKSKKISKFICNDLNFINVYNLEGGITQWRKKGFSVDKSNIAKKKN
jgi:rhodanese-related sulfurtransferase